MIGFLLRKTFYDLWDNLFRIVLVNMGFIAILAIPVFLPELYNSFAFVFAVRAVGILLCSVYLCAAALSVKSISDYGSFGFADFFGKLKESWPAGLVMGLVVFVFVALALIVMPFYFSINSPFGLVLAAIVFWTLVMAALSFQFFFAVRARLNTQLIKVFKKCVLLFFDNPGFAFFLLIHNTAVVILSAMLAFLFPGPAGILLYLDEAIRLRLLKYDWLEANPGADRRKVPWDALLIEEREKTGTRSLKNFIFPWKD